MKKLLLSLLLIVAVTGSATTIHNLGVRNCVQYLCSDCYEVITGLQTIPEIGDSGGTIVMCFNKGPGPIYFAPETLDIATNSFATNRIAAITGGLMLDGEFEGMLEVKAGASQGFWYDPISLRWRIRTGF